MRKKLQIHALVALVACGMMFTSCGNIDIVKRKYRPGFHVDISKKQQKTNVAGQSAVADSRKAEKAHAMQAKDAKAVTDSKTEPLMADARSATPSSNLLKGKRNLNTDHRNFDGFAKLDFNRWVRDAKRGIRPDRSPASGMEWMSWVSFGTGLGAMGFGFLALLFAILFGWSYFIWFAMILAAAAIVFAILYKKQNGTDPKGRLGLLFGIIGGAMAFVALIIWVIHLAAAIGAII